MTIDLIDFLVLCVYGYIIIDLLIDIKDNIRDLKEKLK